MNYRLIGLTVSLSVLLSLSACGKSAEDAVAPDVVDELVTDVAPDAVPEMDAAKPVEQTVDHKTMDPANMDHSTTSTVVEDDEVLSASPSLNSDDTQQDIPEVGHAVMDHGSDDSDSVEHEVDQLNKKFSTTSITANVGDKVKFLNSDSYFHNVYSLSETAQFDLGSYPKGESRTIVLDKPGKIEARCAIHPQMRLEITVEE